MINDVDLQTWVRQQARPVDHLSQGGSAEDLDPLLEVIGDARVVALGESTHGTREFSQFKTRLVGHLVEVLDFRLFALERDIAAVEPLSRYVAGDLDDPRAALTLWSSYPWQTEEFMACADLLRSVNHRRDEPVSLVGFDMQTIDLAVEALGDGPLRIALSGSMSHAWGAESPEPWENIAGMAGQALTEPVASMEGLNLRTIVQMAEQMAAEAAGEKDADLRREKSMADNIVSLVQDIHPGGRAVVWAHNGHIGRYPQMMGSHLTEALGDDFVSIGLFTGGGTYAAATYTGRTLDRTLRPFRIPSMGGDAVGQALSQVEAEMFTIDLRNAHPGMDETFGAFQVGFVGDHPEEIVGPLAGTFDAIFYKGTTSASVPLEWSADEISAEQ